MSTICNHLLGFSFKDKKDYDLLDYYDGPVSGIFTCTHCGLNYGFDMLDWTEEDQRYRLFMLFQLAPQEYDEYKTIIETYSDSEISRDPLKKYQRLGQIIHSKQKPDGLMIFDWKADSFIASIPVPAVESDDVWIACLHNPKSRDWFKFLNLPYQSELS